MITDNNTNKVLKYRLRSTVVDRIRNDKNRIIKIKLINALMLHPDSISRIVRENQGNGLLTTYASTLVISDELNVSILDILEITENESKSIKVRTRSAATDSTRAHRKGNS